MTVAQLSRRMSSREFGDWAAFYNWEAREEQRQRNIAQASARLNRRHLGRRG